MTFSATLVTPSDHLFSFSDARSLSLCRRFPIFVRLGNLRCSRHRPLRLSASLAERRSLDLSWADSDCASSDSDFNGWAAVESQPQRKRKGVPTYAIGAVGTSLTVLVAVIAHYSLSRNGYSFHFFDRLRSWRSLSNQTETEAYLSEELDAGLSDGKSFLSQNSPAGLSDSVSNNVVSDSSASRNKQERVIVPVAVDPTQQEAVMVLERLKIMEEDIKANELCTRREYARWLVRLSSSLERNPKHRIFPSLSLSGSKVAAFDDVSVEDPDFGAIQALAEAGIISSKLSGENSSSFFSDRHGMLFFPERFISRQDLINWRVQLEYDFVPGLEEESRRFQPNKPSTKAQAAIALTSGRMTSAIQTELARLETENFSRVVEMEEIRFELIERGDIKRLWDERLKEEETRGLEVEKDYLVVIDDLEQEKIIQETTFQEHTKEKAALDCQKQLICHLREEVDEMSDRLASERAIYVREQFEMQDTISDLETKHERMLDTKSILGAEIEALRILRSWVEDEARKSQARAKVLEELGRRWRWDGQA
ncbi:uncharacterized protein LOC115750615 isoform X3 [Rhodamnia argentea]|uniref:Uncharacterized protein LOC115750615 isoform X3 n=1 Tax=Rhodamnia argentea TaxID=178133 RepID=A0ABM3HDK7_9MYRT|nr:uncharacterized protein LOC115750615 isoform X3 [Rhodamnia argentea]